MTNVPTPAVERDTKPAANLAEGDWIHGRKIGEHLPCRVLGVHPYVEQGNPQVMVAYEGPDGVPAAVHFDATYAVDMATDAEIDTAQDDARRLMIVARLRDLAALITQHRLPLPHTWSAVDVQFRLADTTAVEAVGKALGVEPCLSSAQLSVEWPGVPAGVFATVEARWVASLPVPAGVDGHGEGGAAGRAVTAQADEFVACGWMTPSGPCHLVRGHPLFPFGPVMDSGHISEASAAENRAFLAAQDEAE
jgi:hypothetical protein